MKLRAPKFGVKADHDHIGCVFCFHETCMEDAFSGVAEACGHLIKDHWDVVERIHAMTISVSANAELEMHQFIAAKAAEREAR